MSRRRLTLAAYARRRWRVVGGITVLLLGALLLLVVADRGHDPLWSARGTELDHVAFAPDGEIVYALVRSDGNLSGIQARAADDGELLWSGSIEATRALLAATEEGAVVVTDFPSALLTLYGTDGAVSAPVALNGAPLLVSADGRRVAVALNVASNPVEVYEGGIRARTFGHATPVRAIDMQEGVLAVGGQGGEVLAYARDGTSLLNTTVPFSVRSLRLTADATAVVVGGVGLAPGDAPGHVAFIDIGRESTVRWNKSGPSRIGGLDLDSAGLYALSIEEEQPVVTLRVYEASTGAVRWSHRMGVSSGSDGSGAFGAAAISPDGEVVVVASVGGDVRALDARDGDTLWRYRAGGGAGVAFPDEGDGRVLVQGRLSPSRPFDSLLLFSVGHEPLPVRLPLVALALTSAAALALALTLGIGYWRARRSY